MKEFLTFDQQFKALLARQAAHGHLARVDARISKCQLAERWLRHSFPVLGTRVTPAFLGFFTMNSSHSVNIFLSLTVLSLGFIHI